MRWLSVRLKWFGLPRRTPYAYGESMLRYDRGEFPRMVPVSSDDRRVIAGLDIDCQGMLIPEGGAIRYLPQEHSDVVRLTCRLGRWRGVWAIYAVTREAWRVPRFGIDCWIDSAKAVREFVVRFYRA